MKMQKTLKTYFISR